MGTELADRGKVWKWPAVSLQQYRARTNFVDNK